MSVGNLRIIGHATASFSNSVPDKELRSLVKTETGLSVRRIDNFTLLSLLATYRLFNQNNLLKTLTGNLSLYSVAEYLSIDLFQSVIINMHNNEPIRPFDFIATVGNAANFHLAKTFNIKGPNIFIGATQFPFTKSCLLAELDLHEEHATQAIIVVWTIKNDHKHCHAFAIENCNKRDVLPECNSGVVSSTLIDELIVNQVLITTPCVVTCTV